jgi:protein-L-isoaspartate(D-aspartate) O-methyltransferase
MLDYTQHNERFVRMLRASGMRDPSIVSAVSANPRHLFIDQYYQMTKAGRRLSRVTDKGPTTRQLNRIYSDAAIPTHQHPPSSSSQPSLVASMLQNLGLREGHRVLEVGAGTGWNAALMGHIVGDSGRVTTVDIQADVTRRARRHLRRARSSNVTVITGDGYSGHTQTGPFDRIVTTVSTPSIPETWIEQLKTGGLMLTVLQETPGDGWDLLVRLKKGKTGMSGGVVDLVGFMTLTGRLSTSRSSRDEVVDLYPGKKARKVHAPWSDFSGGALLRVQRDFHFFAQLEGFLLEPTRSGEHIVSHPDLDGHMISRRDGLDRYGSTALSDRFDKMFTKWADYGSPTRRDYAIRILGRNQKGRGQGWIMEREDARFWFSLR